MNKLYSIAFKRILASLSAQQVTPANIESILNSNKIKPLGSFIYHQLPKNDFKEFVKVPCPVENVDTQQSKQIIKASKSLRASFHVEQQKACKHCPFKQKCSQYLKPGVQNQVNANSDLLVYMSAINNKATLNDNIYIYRVLAGGYKSCGNIQALIDDMKQGAPTIMQYQRVRKQFVDHKTSQEEANPNINKLKNNNHQQKLKSRADNKSKREKTNQFGNLNSNPQQQMKTQKRRQQRDGFKRKQYGLFEQQQKQNIQIRGGRSDNRYDTTNRMQIENDEYDNNYKRQRNARSAGGYNNKPDYRQKRQNRYQGRDNQRYKQRTNNYNNDNQEQFRGDMRKLRGNLTGSTQNPHKSQYRQRQKSQYRQRSDYREDRNRSRSQDRSERPQRPDRRGWSEARNSDKGYQDVKNMDRKFQKAGQTYKNPKVFQAWEDSEDRGSNNRQSNKQSYNPSSFKRQTISEQPQQRRQPAAPAGEKTSPAEQQRIGRRVRK